MARIPEGVGLYAVGDIDGCARLLRNLRELILEDAYRAAEERRIVVYLGDYIDRGPDSRDVIDLAIAGPGEAFECIHLKGNHEAMLLDFLADVGNVDLRRQNRGGATLMSYGVEDGAENQMSSRLLYRQRNASLTSFCGFNTPKATISSSTRACVPASHSTGSRMKICCGFAILFSIRTQNGVIRSCTGIQLSPPRISGQIGSIWTLELFGAAF